MSFFDSIGGIVKDILPIGGAIAGGVVGGPAGAAAGYAGGNLLAGGSSSLGGATATSNAASAAGKLTGLDAYKNSVDSANDRLTPYETPGATAAGNINKLLTDPSSFDPSTLPGYKFNLGEGLNTLYNQGAAMGLSSGNLKGAGTFASGLANSYYNDYFNRLLKTAGLGLEASTQAGKNTIGYGNSALETYAGVGNNAGNAATAPYLNQLTNGIFGKNQGSQGSNGISGTAIEGVGGANALNGIIPAGALDLGTSMPWLA